VLSDLFTETSQYLWMQTQLNAVYASRGQVRLSRHCDFVFLAGIVSAGE
jgi:hypothetical protein